MSHPDLRGIVSPILTPFNDDGTIATRLYIDHALASLEAGVHYLSPFGTTGEAVACGMSERMEMLERLVDAGIPPDRLMPGTGLCALPDTVLLTRHAADLGCAAAMVLPPFYYPHSEDGLYTYFARLIEAVQADRLRLCMYHIPKMTGVAISPALTARLNAAFPETVVAYKDSDGDWTNTKAVIDAAPGVSVFPASEVHLVQGIGAGAAGCISATCNSNPSVIRAYWDARQHGDEDRAEALRPGMEAHRQAVQAAGFIPALKAMMATATGEARWLNTRPPMDDADPALGQRLVDQLGWSWPPEDPRQPRT
ncbi:MAG: dihydrodipicolinate synthase family protein [Rhodobacteraceae bacterium]|nr:MAG: dihydrodipicolinate synthase family protein [Paracoccaceae bacterium]